MYCPSCGTEAAAQDGFCRQCGKPLLQAAPPATEAVPTAQPTPPAEEQPILAQEVQAPAARAPAKKRRRDWAVIPALLGLIAIIIILFFLMRTRPRPDENMAARPTGSGQAAPETAPVPVPQVYVPGAPQPAQPGTPAQPPAEQATNTPEPGPQPTPQEATKTPQQAPAPQPAAPGPPAQAPMPAPRTGPGPVPQDFYEFWFQPAQYTGFSDKLEDLTDMELDSNVARVHVRLDYISRFMQGGTMMTWDGYDRRGGLVRHDRRPLTAVDAGWLGMLGVDPATAGQYQPGP